MGRKTNLIQEVQQPKQERIIRVNVSKDRPEYELTQESRRIDAARETERRMEREASDA